MVIKKTANWVLTKARGILDQIFSQMEKDRREWVDKKFKTHIKWRNLFLRMGRFSPIRDFDRDYWVKESKILRHPGSLAEMDMKHWLTEKSQVFDCRALIKSATQCDAGDLVTLSLKDMYTLGLGA